jgi:hypothetical protein
MTKEGLLRNSKINYFPQSIVSIDNDVPRYVNNILTEEDEGDNPTMLSQQGSMSRHFHICLYIHDFIIINNTLPKFIICFPLKLHTCTEVLHLLFVTFA